MICVLFMCSLNITFAMDNNTNIQKLQMIEINDQDEILDVLLNEVREDDIPFGGELSGHVYFRDRWPGFDSGLYAGLRMVEILSKTDKSVDELLEGINTYYSTPEEKFTSPDDKKFGVIEKIKEYVISKNYKYNDIDGIRVDFPDSWALVRCSNTGPNITTRFEANTEERLKEIKQEFDELIEKYNK